jgi:hypothetical protein
MKLSTFYIYILLITIILSCKTNHETTGNNLKIKQLRFIGEQIIPDSLVYKNTLVGGLSSIDYANDKYYLISDDKKKPVRFYEMDLSFDKNSFSKVKITNVITIKSNSEFVDPESLRFDKITGNFLWASEGAIKEGISPAVFEIDVKGQPIKTFKTPKMFQVTNLKKHGPRKNGTFEGLSMSYDTNYFWVGMELPLKEDGKKPELKPRNSPVRISKINRNTGGLAYQFVYQLDAIPRDSKPSGKFMVNGLPEILEIGNNTFLFIERAYASGHKDGGNTVKIFLVDASNATDVSKIKSLKKAQYIPSKKSLLFDFESIRSKLTNGIVDNIEGITFGKTLSNGNKTLVVVSDNNFNKFSKQLSQIIVFEVLPNVD